MRVLCFVLLLSIAATATSSQNSCMNKNSFLASMSTAKPLSVEIHNMPQHVNDGTCGYEWKTFGTCCKTEDLKGFYKLESELITINNDNLNHALHSTVHTIASKLSNLNMNDLRSQIYDAYNSFHHNSNICWDYMKKVRGKALCSICSGRSEHYFHGQKMLISPETCLEGVKNCDNFFIKLSALKKLVIKIQSAFIEHKAEKYYFESLLRLKLDVETYSPPRELQKAFDKYNSYESTLKARESINICSMIMNVRKTPYILVMNPRGIEALYASLAHKLWREYLERLAEVHADFVAANAAWHAAIPAYHHRLVQADLRYHELVSLEAARYRREYDLEVKLHHANVANEVKRHLQELAKLDRQPSALEYHTKRAEEVNRYIKIIQDENARHVAKLSSEGSQHTTTLHSDHKNWIDTRTTLTTEFHAINTRNHENLTKGNKEAHDLYVTELTKRGMSRLEQYKNWDKDLKSQNDEIIASASSPVPRILQKRNKNSRELLLETNLLGSSTNHFRLESDSLVFFRPSDNMFDSFVGTKGSFSDEISQKEQIPMNMTLNFL